jgi:hypothetical protein
MASHQLETNFVEVHLGFIQCINDGSELLIRHALYKPLGHERIIEFAASTDGLELAADLDEVVDVRVE